MSVNKNQVINSTSTRADMLAHMGSLQQAAYVRPIEYQEGRAHGLKAIEVKNGPLRFVSMADRALDVCQFEYRGENLTFLSKPGLNGRNSHRSPGLAAPFAQMPALRPATHSVIATPATVRTAHAVTSAAVATIDARLTQALEDLDVLPHREEVVDARGDLGTDAVD